EQSQFSTRMLIGARPEVGSQRNENDLLIQLETPFLLGGLHALGSTELHQEIAARHGTMTIEQLLTIFGKRATILSISAAPEELIEVAIERLQNEAIQAVLEGTQCLILDDSAVIDG